MHRSRHKLRSPRLTVGGAAILGLVAVAFADNYTPPDYEYGFQEHYGQLATFFTSGPATGSPPPDNDGDGLLAPA